jgi:hypothetical protein
VNLPVLRFDEIAYKIRLSINAERAQIQPTVTLREGSAGIAPMIGLGLSTVEADACTCDCKHAA